MNIKNKIKYYLWSSYRRKLLDKLQIKYSYLYKGMVLDIGGRDRGLFKKPKDKVEKWIFADIVSEHNPDIILDVADMKGVESESVDVVNAMELFEHVEKIEDGIGECCRVLKRGGIFIISVPFLYQIHADPYDYQRWTEDKWKKILFDNNFTIENLEIMGRFFTLMAGMLKNLINVLPKYLKLFFMIFYPILDLLVKLDDTKFVLNNNKLNKYHGGYFIVAKK